MPDTPPSDLTEVIKRIDAGNEAAKAANEAAKAAVSATKEAAEKASRDLAEAQVRIDRLEKKTITQSAGSEDRKFSISGVIRGLCSARRDGHEHLRSLSAGTHSARPAVV